VSSGSLKIDNDVPLAPLTTLGLGGPARYLIEARDEDTVRAAVTWSRKKGLRLVVLGGGSNVVVADAGFQGVVLRMDVRGTTFGEDGEVFAAAGEPWDALVTAAVARRLAGLECLAGIPGLVGATPIQNVGAYGQEVSEVIREVRVLERGSGRIVALPVSACGFAYRDSRFRREPEAHVVLGVRFALRPRGVPVPRYDELKDAIAHRMAGKTASLADVSNVVRTLRRKKSMVIDPTDPNRRSVGSFFTNPVLGPDDVAALTARLLATGAVDSVAPIPQHPAQGGRVKIPAAWLIERAGFAKGFRRGAVGVSTAHALALIHHGGGSTAALIALAIEIRDTVAARFGVTLLPEPIFIGATWPQAM
jgi:UDP-N-acetylmuramate dehydrogenase